jgi:DNA-3-methyladenine glycosylase
VLLRALQPAYGVETMRERRRVEAERLLCAGPGRLCQALAITREHDGLPLDARPFELLARPAEPLVAAGPRIGISVAREAPWRYAVAGSPWLSRPVQSAG